MQQGRSRLGRLKFYNAKMNPVRRSRSLEGNLDNIDHVTIGEDDSNKGRVLYSSHPHGIEGNQQRSAACFNVSPILGRRLEIIATPTSSSPLPPATSSSPKTSKVHIQHQSDPKSTPLSKTQQQNVSSEVTAKEDQQLQQNEDVVQMKFKDSKMTRPKSVAHTQHSIPAAARGGMPTSSEQLPNQCLSYLRRPTTLTLLRQLQLMTMHSGSAQIQLIQ